MLSLRTLRLIMFADNHGPSVPSFTLSSPEPPLSYGTQRDDFSKVPWRET